MTLVTNLLLPAFFSFLVPKSAVLLLTNITFPHWFPWSLLFKITLKLCSCWSQVSLLALAPLWSHMQGPGKTGLSAAQDQGKKHQQCQKRACLAPESQGVICSVALWGWCFGWQLSVSLLGTEVQSVLRKVRNGLQNFKKYQCIFNSLMFSKCSC